MGNEVPRVGRSSPVFSCSSALIEIVLMAQMRQSINHFWEHSIKLWLLTLSNQVEAEVVQRLIWRVIWAYIPHRIWPHIAGVVSHRSGSDCAFLPSNLWSRASTRSKVPSHRYPSLRKEWCHELITSKLIQRA